MAESVSIQFSITVRTLGRIANQLGYVTANSDAHHHLRNISVLFAEITMTLALNCHKRSPRDAVLADIVEGFQIANASWVKTQRSGTYCGTP